MARFMTRYGVVAFPTRGPRRNPKKRKGRGKKKARRKAQASAQKAAKKNPASRSKKIGRWRCAIIGGSKARKVTCAGASHTYKTPAAAITAYKRINSVKSVENFVTRYGKKATKKAVAGVGKKKAKRKTTKKRNPCECTKIVKSSTSSMAVQRVGKVVAAGIPGRKVRRKTYKTEANAKKAYDRLSSVAAVARWVGFTKSRRNAPMGASQAAAMKAVLRAHGNPSPKWNALTKNKLPGNIIDTTRVSSSTVRSWAKKGWIKHRGGGYYTLTQKGYIPTKRRNPKRRKARNAPLSATEKRSLRSVLKKHGYLR